MGVHRALEAKRAFAPSLEIGIKNQIFLEKTEVGVFRLIDLILAMTVFCWYETHAAQESGSQL